VRFGTVVVDEKLKLTSKLLAAAATVPLSWGGQNSASPKEQAIGLASAAVVQEIMREDPLRRDADLRKLVNSGSEDVQISALAALMRLHAEKLEPLTVQVALRVSDLSLLMLSGAVEDSKDPYLARAFARECLRRAVANPDGPKATEGHPARAGLAGAAAVILADSPDPSDRDLVQAAVKVRPDEGGLWLAISKMGIATAADINLAHAVFERQRGLDRIAAAGALAPSDSKAKEFVVKELTTFLSGLGQIDAQTLISQFYAESSKIGRDRSQFATFYSHAMALPVLAFIQIPEAEAITFEFIDSPNQFVRGTLGVIAAKRWPERLMKTALTRNSERMDLLVTITAFHPEMLAQIRSLIPPPELEKRLAKLKDKPAGTLVSSSMMGSWLF